MKAKKLEVKKTAGYENLMETMSVND